MDSVPEYQAPPPPAKKGSHSHNGDHLKNSFHDSVFDVYDHPPTPSGKQEPYDRPRSGGQELYDRPRLDELGGSRASLEEEDDDDDVYKVPPSAGGRASLLRVTRGSAGSDTMDLSAAVPLPMPRNSPRSARSSLGDRPDSTASGGRPLTENYDVPPPRRTSTSSQEGSGSAPAPPQRPPKPHSLAAQSPYQNLPTNSKAYEGGGLSTVLSAPPKTCSTALSYDVPRASTVISPPRDSSLLDHAPPAPAPRPCGPSAGPSYLNTVPGLPNSPAVPPLPSTYQHARNGERAESGLAYADIDNGPTSAPSVDRSYADMSGVGGGGGRGGQGLYQVPPVGPRPPARSGTVPAHRSQGAAATGPGKSGGGIGGGGGRWWGGGRCCGVRIIQF